MKRVGLEYMVLFVTVLFFTGCSDPGSPAGSQLVINGSGATFPAPLYANWSYNYSHSNDQQVLVNYQGVGSGAGINQVREGAVDFAGTDSPLTEQEQIQENLVQFPMVGGGVTVVYNIPGITPTTGPSSAPASENTLKLSQTVLSKIFLGQITNWSDAQIQADNPELKLPDLRITVVHRSDSSGTTFIFTNYLSKISSEWKSGPGEGKSINWPCGLGGQKNPGICNNVKKIAGAIGYTELTYALEASLPSARLQNSDGRYISPTDEAIELTLACADWEHAPGNYMVLTNLPGPDSYPITAVTYIVYSRNLPDERKAALFDYINWCFRSGEASARQLHYAPIAGSLVDGIWQR